MSSRKIWVAGLLLAAVAPAPVVRAQVPGAAVAPGGGSTAANAALAAAGAGGATPAAAAPAAAAQPQTLFGFLGLSSNNIHACITKLCSSQLGQMANSMITGPIGGVSGGLIPPLCPPAPCPVRLQPCRTRHLAVPKPRPRRSKPARQTPKLASRLWSIWEPSTARAGKRPRRRSSMPSGPTRTNASDSQLRVRAQ